MARRWTIKELKEMSTRTILAEILGERLAGLTNPYAPLAKELVKLRNWLLVTLPDGRLHDEPAPNKGTFGKKIKIDYYWKCDAFKKDLPRELVEELETLAWERIRECLDQGYTSGELCADVLIDVPGKQTPEDGWSCRGWFNVDKEDN